MSVFRWPDMSLTALGIKVHEFAQQHGRCVVFLHGNTVSLRSANDARNCRDIDDALDTFTARDRFERIHERLLSGMLASMGES